MTKTLGAVTTVLLLITTACATGGAAGGSDDLRTVVGAYNEHLRWKRFPAAARFLKPESQAPFLSRYLTAEDDLFVEALEVRAVTFGTDELTPSADVTVVATAYVLPSTVLEKVVMTQHWELVDKQWVLITTDRELVPAVAPLGSPTPEAPATGTPE